MKLGTPEDLMMRLGTPEDLMKLDGHLRLKVRYYNDECAVGRLYHDDRMISAFVIDPSGTDFFVKIDGLSFSLEVESVDGIVYHYSCRLYCIVEDKQHNAFHHDKNFLVVPDMTEEMLKEASEQKSLLVRSVCIIQRMLSKIFEKDEESSPPVLEITPGGCNVIISEEVVVDSESAERAIQVVHEQSEV